MTSLTKSELRQLVPVLQQIGIEVMLAKESRRWKIKLTSSRERLRA